jgi:uncharacterized protein (DUF433 family)
MMSKTQDKYVSKDENGVLRAGGGRVMLDSVVAAFEQGHSPESIRVQYPSLSLEEVYGAITWCLAHPDEVRAYLKRQDDVWQQAQARSEQNPSAVVERLRALRRAGTAGAR